MAVPVKVTPDRLADSLKRQLAPIYVVAGDEPLLVAEATDAIRAAARAADYSEREVFFAERGFNWASLAEASANLSLFASRRLMELRLPTGKPGDQGARALGDYAERPPEDTVLLVIAETRLDRSFRGAKWLGKLEKTGVLVEVWPVQTRQLPSWINQRMQQRGLQPTRDAVLLLAERVEGNLLAASQEIDKLVLLNGPGPVDADAVTRAVADSARYDLFGFVDVVLAGRTARALRMLDGLRAEGTEPPVVLWGLARELRQLASIAFELGRGTAPGAAMSRAGVWSKRQPVVKSALDRHPPAVWPRLLQRAARVDRTIKGLGPGEAWHELIQLTLNICGPEEVAID